jgi:NADPH:quinone reductase-like Zn-dependent oxidoreductase
MKAFAVLAPHSAGRVPVHDACRVRLHGVEVDFAIVEQADITMDAADPRHAHDVLLQIGAFSCNYREQARFLEIARRTDSKGYVVLGSEFVATVLATGAAVDDLQPGDRVIGNGAIDASASHPGLTTQRGSAELQICHRAKLIRIPAMMPSADAAAFSIAAQTAYAMVRRLGLRRDEHVLVTAASSNTSLFAIEALLGAGLHVHALTTSPHIGAHLAQRGLHRYCVLDRQQNPAQALATYLDAQGLRAFDAVIDPFMDIYLRKLVPFLRRGGKYITCGVFEQFSRPHEPFQYHGLTLDEMFSLIIRKSIHMIGNNLGEQADLERALADYCAGRLPVALDSVHGNGQLDRFVHRSYLAPDRTGKVVFDYHLPTLEKRAC